MGGETLQLKGQGKHCVYMCGVTQHAEDSVPNLGNDVADQKNEQAVCVPNENYRNPLREAKHQRELLKDYFNHAGALAGQEEDLRCGNQQTWGRN